MITTWQRLLDEEKNKNNDTTPIVNGTKTDVELNEEFYNEFGGGNSVGFKAWSFTHAYFENNYDGMMSVISVERDPEYCKTLKD